MSKKHLFSVSKVKNDSDVIESFCRHHLRFLNGMIICDDGSSDTTVQIVESLIDEGLNIILLHRSDYPRDILLPDNPFYDWMIGQAIDQYGADIVLPMTADEFLYSCDGRNPREILETIDETIIYKLRRSNAVFEKDPDDSSVFLPDFFSEYLNETWDKNGRIIMTRHLYHELGGRLSIGAHHIEFQSREGWIPPYSKEGAPLSYAHFPVRGTVQYTLKIITGWYTFMLYNLPGAAWHWKKAYEVIKQEGMLSCRQTRALSLYGYEEGVDIQQKPKGFLLIGNSPIHLKYTDYQTVSNCFWNQMLSHIEHLFERSLPNRQ